MRIVLLLAWLIPAVPGQSTDFLAEGIRELDAGRNAAAVELFKKAVAGDPSQYGAHFHLGLAYSLTEQDALAIVSYKKALELRPGLYEALLNLGISLLNDRQAVDAALYLRQAVEQKPGEFRPVYYLGEAWLDAKQYGEAATAFSRAVQLDPASAPAEMGLARALAHRGSRAEAEPHYRKAAQMDPGNRSYLLELASLYEDNRELPEALKIYREFPENPGAQERAGMLLLRSGQAAEAIPVLESVVTQSPTAANRIALAQAYVKEKQPAKAEPLASQAAAAAPGDFDVRMFYGRILRDQRKFTLASQQFRAATQMKPDAAEAWSELAGVLILDERPGEGLAALDRIRALGAETGGHVYLRAITLDRLKQPKEALEAYSKFLSGSTGANPDEEFLARQRVRILERELGKR